jgi:hypothetical protein
MEIPIKCPEMEKNDFLHVLNPEIKQSCQYYFKTRICVLCHWNINLYFGVIEYNLP